MRARLALLWLCSSWVACGAAGADVRSVWLPAYLFGSVGGGDLDVRDVCASGTAQQLSVGSSFGTLGVSVLTLGVYTPREAKVQCVPLR